MWRIWLESQRLRNSSLHSASLRLSLHWTLFTDSFADMVLARLSDSDERPEHRSDGQCSPARANVGGARPLRFSPGSAPTILDQLRSAIAEAHARLERDLDLLALPILEDHFQSVLTAFYGFHKAWEPWVSKTSFKG